MYGVSIDMLDEMFTTVTYSSSIFRKNKKNIQKRHFTVVFF